MPAQLVRFDWAIKKLLRHKANFSILEGFLTELLRFEVKIENILESESNKENLDDKYNRVDLLVKSSEGELMLVEIQNESQIDYFQRMIYGASKLITEYIKQGEPYSSIKKVYSIHIVYFAIGQGKDYVYEYNGKFVGMHYKDVLTPTKNQMREFEVDDIADIFPQYYLLKVNNFNDVAKDSLDEWIYFLKNSEVPENFHAKGIDEAREKLRIEQLSQSEKISYEIFAKNRRIERSVLETAWKNGERKGMEKGMQQGLEKGKQMGIKDLVLRMHAQSLDIEKIAQFTGLPIEQVREFVSKS